MSTNSVLVRARIQAHPSRGDLHGPLLRSVAPLDAALSMHESSPPNPLNGYLKALSDPPDCSHLLVLQDDVVVCRNFGLAVERIAAANPHIPVSLFLAKLPQYEARMMLRTKHRYFDARPKINSFLPVIAVLWPIEKAEQFREWCKRTRLPGSSRREPASDDAAFGYWALRCKERVRISVPSLVEHPDRVPSIIGKRAKWGRDATRVALVHIGEGDPLDLDWS